MTIEKLIEENSNQLRQIMLLIDDGFKMIKSMAGKPVVTGDGAALPTIDTVSTTLATTTTGAPEITTEDFGELDAMGCPFDPTIMGTNRTKNKSGKLKDCWKKKKDAAYTEEMYMEDRRKLIASVEASAPSPAETDRDDILKKVNDARSTPDETTTDAPPPPALADNTAPPPPPATAVAEDIIELPSIPNFETVTTDEFTELCRVFVLKRGEDGARCIAENMKKCGFSPADTPDKVARQDQLTWITQRIIEHDTVNA